MSTIEKIMKDIDEMEERAKKIDDSYSVDGYILALEHVKDIIRIRKLEEDLIKQAEERFKDGKF